MTRGLLLLIGVLALLCGLVGWRLGDERARADQLEQQLAAQKVLEAQLQARADTLERRFRVDTGHLRVAVAHWNTAKARLDTAWLHDTVPVPVEAVAALANYAFVNLRADFVPFVVQPSQTDPPPKNREWFSLKSTELAS